MITEFKSEFSRVAAIVGAEYQTLAIDELQEFVQAFDFSIPLINWSPIESFDSNIGAAGEIVWDGTCILQFLTLATVGDTEDFKDGLIDNMINLSGDFYRNLNQNTERVFRNPIFTMRNNIERFKTANYCVGVESNIVFTTSCNRIS